MRAPRVDNNGFKKGAWSEEEDNKLRAYILRYGHWNWRLLPNFAGLARCGKSCRLRWVNYLKPGVKRGNYSKEEDDLIVKLHDELGNRWAAIASRLPGRTDNEIKNYWHTNLKKRSKIIPEVPENHVMQQKSSQMINVCKNSQEESLSCLDDATEAPEYFQGSNIHILESLSGSNSWNPVDPEDSATSSRSAQQVHTRIFLPEKPVVGGISCGPVEISQGHNDGKASPSDWFDGFEESFWTEPFQVENSYCQYDNSFSPLDGGALFSSYLLTSDILIGQ